MTRSRKTSKTPEINGIAERVNYHAISPRLFFKHLVGRCVMVIGLVAILFHIPENPLPLSLMALVCILVLLSIGDDQVTVTNKKITVYNNAFGRHILRRKPKTWIIADIKYAFLQDTGNPLAGDLLNTVFTQKRKDHSEVYYIVMSSGEETSFAINMERSRMEEMVAAVNKCIQA